PDPTIDASLFGVFYFGCFDVNDDMVVNTMQAVSKSLAAGGGIARFEEDGYMRGTGPEAGNAWFICTLWMAEYYIAKASRMKELSPALTLIEWVTERALPSGILSEQFDPESGIQVSVSPLTWSHSTFVSTVLSYQSKANEFN
ncbi:MAG TPA: glycoside hydrolase family 15 protein, partial [Pyrinomonadaceae bacterium]|nr:glycoside hydrolase family 15 protein [Pyrinomonadaceae bacterium]